MEGLDKRIDEIPDKKHVILLLDGLDEGTKAIEDSEARKRELLAKVRDFRKVIITCRSQFFIDERLEWESTGVLQQHSKKDQTFGKVFISLFDDKDIDEYLKQQYGNDPNKYRKAEEVVNKIPDLSMRALILNYVEDLYPRMAGRRQNGLCLFQQYYGRGSAEPDHAKRAPRATLRLASRIPRKRYEPTPVEYNSS